jgi:molybdate transport system permease protein
LSSTDRRLAILAGVGSAALMAFIVLPVLAIFLRVPPGRLISELHSTVALQALAVSLKTSAIALFLILLIGTPAAYLLATTRFPGRSALIALTELPLVLPPAVAGIGLFAAFGRAGLLGGALRALGVEIPFTQIAVVMALAFVSLPFYVRQAVASFAALDPAVLGASRTLGAGAGGTFVRVAVPMARPGLAAGAALAWARALGEFGATLMFAGNLQGRTQTLPLAVFEEFSRGDLDGALAVAALLVVVSAGLLMGVRALVRAGGDAEGGSSWIPFSRSRSVIV